MGGYVYFLPARRLVPTAFSLKRKVIDVCVVMVSVMVVSVVFVKVVVFVPAPTRYWLDPSLGTRFTRRPVPTAAFFVHGACCNRGYLGYLGYSGYSGYTGYHGSPGDLSARVPPGISLWAGGVRQPGRRDKTWGSPLHIYPPGGWVPKQALASRL